jgi:two-component system chemotaxis sensor kinase CheA
MIVYFRGEVIPLETLRVILSGNSQNEKSYENYYDQNIEIPVVVLKTSLGSKFGIIVDRLNKNMEIAIKPLPKQLGNNRLVNGVTIMGDGGVVQVLNVDNFLSN